MNILIAARKEMLSEKVLIFKGSAKQIQLNQSVVIVRSVRRLNSDN